MSPKKIEASSNIYTALLALVCGIAGATAGLVAYKCYFDYETLFKIVNVFR
ncbi:MAG: hypothetical protein K8R02_00345 [Anaerohalosphaeraceae bacterium]|nr:hypothetical protein [Anaerohalosphaeraceae bacterium]